MWTPLHLNLGGVLESVKMGVAILSVDVNDVEPVKAHRMNLRSRGNELESVMLTYFLPVKNLTPFCTSIVQNRGCAQLSRQQKDFLFNINDNTGGVDQIIHFAVGSLYLSFLSGGFRVRERVPLIL